MSLTFDQFCFIYTILAYFSQVFLYRKLFVYKLNIASFSTTLFLHYLPYLYQCLSFKALPMFNVYTIYERSIFLNFLIYSISLLGRIINDGFLNLFSLDTLFLLLVAFYFRLMREIPQCIASFGTLELKLLIMCTSTTQNV